LITNVTKRRFGLLSSGLPRDAKTSPGPHVDHRPWLFFSAGHACSPLFKETVLRNSKERIEQLSWQVICHDIAAWLG